MSKEVLLKDHSHLMTSAVYTILEHWCKIDADLQLYPQSTAMEHVVNSYYLKEDQVIAKTFYDHYQADEVDGKYIRWNESYWKYYASIQIIRSDTGMTFGFPFNCRQWAFSSLLENIINRIQQSPSVVHLGEFLTIWRQEKDRVIWPLADNDIRVLRQIANFRQHEGSKLLINEKEIAKSLNLSQSYVCERIKYLNRIFVLDYIYHCNAAKLGFITILTQEPLSYKNCDRLLLGKIPIVDSESFYLYQIPLSWMDNSDMPKEVKEFDFLEYGYATAYLRPNNKTEHQIPHSFNDPPESAVTTSKILDISPNYIDLTNKELEILKYFSPAHNNLSFKPQDIAAHFDISRSWADECIRRFIAKNLLYALPRFCQLGFFINNFIYASADEKQLSALCHYLRQAFHFRFYTRPNEVLAYIESSPMQNSQLIAEINSYKSEFDWIHILQCQNDQNSFVRRSVDFTQLAYEYDSFMELRWNNPQPNH